VTLDRLPGGGVEFMPTCLRLVRLTELRSFRDPALSRLSLT